MTLQLFLETLEANPAKRLSFVLPDGTNLRGDLHITEVKNITVESVDCGSNNHAFRETVIQLWVNAASAKPAEWTTDKALSILKKVQSGRPLVPGSELFFEYGDAERPTISYSIGELSNSAEQIELRLAVKPVQCKPGTLASEPAGCC